MSCKRKILIYYLLTSCLIFILIACGNFNQLEYGEITDRPLPNQEMMYNIQLNKTESEIWEPNQVGSIDLRSMDLRNENLQDKMEYLEFFEFDTKTILPIILPENFNPDKLLELGIDPGLNIRELHEKGVTGKNVGIEIIDQPLLVDHEEYKNQLVLYHSYNKFKNENASMHGPGVASLAVGKNIGVAPDAKLYFISDDYALYGEKTESGDMTTSLGYLSKDIDRIIALNKTLDDKEKIKVISISIGYTSDKKDRDKFELAVKRAKNEGIEVLCLGYNNTMSEYMGMGRTMYGNPNMVEDFRPAYMSISFNVEQTDKYPLLIPMDKRTIASGIGTSEYHYMPIGGGS